MPDTKQAVTILSRVPLFQSLKRRQLEMLAARLTERSYQKEDFIVTQGKGGEGFFVISSGSAEAIRVRADGTKVVLNPLNEGDFFGELALLSDSTRTASVVATAPTVCYILTRWDFLGLLKDDVDMSVTVLQELAERFVRVMNTL
jgi:CRP-like cAMP-binding protein